MKLLKYIIVLYLVMAATNFGKAADNDFSSLFQTNYNTRARNINIDHVVSAKLITFTALAEQADVTYAYESQKQNVFCIHGGTSGLSEPPEKTPKMASRRLEYLSLWLATIKPEETFEGKELKSPIIIIGRETAAFDGWEELPQILFRKILKNNESVVFGLNKVPVEKVKKTISNLVVWRKDGQVFYQEAMHKKEGEEGRKLWEDIKTLNLPEDGPFYIIVDVGIGEKGKNKILDRFKKEREFQKRMKELESGINKQ